MVLLILKYPVTAFHLTFIDLKYLKNGLLTDLRGFLFSGKLNSRKDVMENT